MWLRRSSAGIPDCTFYEAPCYLQCNGYIGLRSLEQSSVEHSHDGSRSLASPLYLKYILAFKHFVYCSHGRVKPKNHFSAFDNPRCYQKHWEKSVVSDFCLQITHINRITHMSSVSLPALRCINPGCKQLGLTVSEGEDFAAAKIKSLATTAGTLGWQTQVPRPACLFA